MWWIYSAKDWQCSRQGKWLWNLAAWLVSESKLLYLQSLLWPNWTEVLAGAGMQKAHSCASFYHAWFLIGTLAILFSHHITTPIIVCACLCAWMHACMCVCVCVCVCLLQQHKDRSLHSCRPRCGGACVTSVLVRSETGGIPGSSWPTSLENQWPPGSMKRPYRKN